MRLRGTLSGRPKGQGSLGLCEVMCSTALPIILKSIHSVQRAPLFCKRGSQFIHVNCIVGEENTVRGTVNRLNEM